MKDNFNLTKSEFNRELKKRVNTCPTCDSSDLIIQILMGGVLPCRITAKCCRCGREVTDFHMIETVGTKNSLATIVTPRSLIKCLQTVLRNFKDKKYEKTERSPI